MAWQHRVSRDCYDMFPNLSEIINCESGLDATSLANIITEQLKSLAESFEFYFPKEQDPREGNSWICNPFLQLEEELNVHLEDLLLDLAGGQGLKNIFLQRNNTRRILDKEDDQEYDDWLTQAASCSIASELLQLFVTLLMFNEEAVPLVCGINLRGLLAEDFLSELELFLLILDRMTKSRRVRAKILSTDLHSRESLCLTLE
ncbi:hypothetical protein LOD99_15165 [Oopsacas minuta]|uniref:Uncharacterized protein n=1 Tax=Oopsacas minuta TaxID=111878 RepID=A0AAV7KDR6_9METZ|nr:hypothetical protein LOD99_15165 [Oopsacas minuta]